MPVDATRVPPLMVPPVFNRPVLVNTKSSLMSPIVILPETVTVPVERVTCDVRLLLPVAVIEMELQDKDPDPTASVILSLLLVPAPIETVPETVIEFDPLTVTVLELLPPEMVRDLQTAAVLTVTLKLLGITTSCADVGT